MTVMFSQKKTMKKQEMSYWRYSCSQFDPIQTKYKRMLIDRYNFFFAGWMSGTDLWLWHNSSHTWPGLYGTSAGSHSLGGGDGDGGPLSWWWTTSRRGHGPALFLPPPHLSSGGLQVKIVTPPPPQKKAVSWFSSSSVDCKQRWSPHLRHRSPEKQHPRKSPHLSTAQDWFQTVFCQTKHAQDVVSLFFASAFSLLLSSRLHEPPGQMTDWETALEKEIARER